MIRVHIVALSLQGDDTLGSMAIRSHSTIFSQQLTRSLQIEKCSATTHINVDTVSIGNCIIWALCFPPLAHMLPFLASMLPFCRPLLFSQIAMIAFPAIHQPIATLLFAAKPDLSQMPLSERCSQKLANTRAIHIIYAVLQFVGGRLQHQKAP